MGEFISNLFKYSVTFLFLCLFLGWIAIPFIIILAIALAINDYYQKEREKDPEYIAKKKEELKREIEEDKRKEAEYARMREENLRKYYE
jgi:flagellar biosynthesis component FlhA